MRLALFAAGFCIGIIVVRSAEAFVPIYRDGG